MQNPMMAIATAIASTIAAEGLALYLLFGTRGVFKEDVFGTLLVVSFFVSSAIGSLLFRRLRPTSGGAAVWIFVLLFFVLIGLTALLLSRVHGIEL